MKQRERQIERQTDKERPIEKCREERYRAIVRHTQTDKETDATNNRVSSEYQLTL